MNSTERERAMKHLSLINRAHELARWNRKPVGNESWNHWWLYRPSTEARASHLAGEP